MSKRRLCAKCRPMFEESYLASARHVLKDGAILVKEKAVIEAAVLAKNSWRGDRHGLASIFTTLAETVEAYEAAKEQ